MDKTYPTYFGKRNEKVPTVVKSDERFSCCMKFGADDVAYPSQLTWYNSISAHNKLLKILAELNVK